MSCLVQRVERRANSVDTHTALGEPVHVRLLVQHEPAAQVGAALVLMCLTYFDVLGRELYGRFMSMSIVTVGAITLAAALGNLRARALA